MSNIDFSDVINRICIMWLKEKFHEQELSAYIDKHNKLRNSRLVRFLNWFCGYEIQQTKAYEFLGKSKYSLTYYELAIFKYMRHINCNEFFVEYDHRSFAFKIRNEKLQTPAL